MEDNYSLIFSISYVHVLLPFCFVFDDVVLPFVRAVIKGQKRIRNVMAVESYSTLFAAAAVAAATVFC